MTISAVPPTEFPNLMFRKSLPALIALLITVPTGIVTADDSDRTDFARDIRPFLRFHCVDCHSGDDPEGGVLLESYEDSARVQTDFEVWEKVLRVLDNREMPPQDSPQPPASGAPAGNSTPPWKR